MSPSSWCGCRPPQVPTRSSFLTPSWISSSKTIVAPGQPMPVPWTETRLALVRAGVAEQAALGVPLHDVVEVGLGDVLGAQRVARQQAGLGVVARLGSHVDRHPRDPIRARSRAWRTSSSRRSSRSSSTAPRTRSSASSSRTSPAAGSAASAGSRTDGRLVALCHVGRERRPVRARLRRLRDVAVRARARMLIGEQRAVSELWEAARQRLPAAARGPARPARLRDLAPLRSRARPACARPRSPTSTCSCPRARAPTRASSASTRSGATRTASAGARGRRSRRAARGSGRRTASSSSRRRRRRGRRRPCSCSRCGPIPAARGARQRRAAGSATCPAAARARAERLPLRPRRERGRDRALRAASGWSHVLDYRSVLL